MLKNIAIVFGIVFVVVGILGFIPALTPNGLLLGLFNVNTLHNIVHLATGIIALIIAMNTPAAMSMFFRVFGVIYALVAILGFVYGDQPLLGLIANNAADTWLHVIIAVFALWVGFGMKAEAPAAV